MVHVVRQTTHRLVGGLVGDVLASSSRFFVLYCTRECRISARGHVMLCAPLRRARPSCSASTRLSTTFPPLPPVSEYMSSRRALLNIIMRSH